MEAWQVVHICILVGCMVGVICALYLCCKYFQELPPDEEDEEDKDKE